MKLNNSGFCAFTKIYAEGHFSPQDLLVLKEGLVSKDLLEEWQLPEIQKQELKKKRQNKKPTNQTQHIAVKNILDAHFTGKVNRCSLSTFRKIDLKPQVTNCKDNSEISVLSFSFSWFLNINKLIFSFQNI